MGDKVTISDRIRQQKKFLLEHCEGYPAIDNREKLLRWQQTFDLIRADIERLEYAQKCQAPTSGSIELR
jgi:hypothetical protein